MPDSPAAETHQARATDALSEPADPRGPALDPDRGEHLPSPASASASAGHVEESRGARFARKAHRARLHLYAFVAVAILVYVVALAASNTHKVRVDWVFGSGSVSLVWLVLCAAILGWLLGILITSLFRWRTRPPSPGSKV